jgi:hypothetical protein
MPLKVSELIKLLDEAILEAKNPGKKKAVLDKILQPIGYADEAELDPGDFLNAEQTQTILEKLITLTSIETKSYSSKVGLREARVNALKAIAEWAAAKGARLSAIFSSVGRYEVAVQMAFRVRRPSSMNQGPQGFCGPASVLVPMARGNPLHYVGFVTSLFDKGVATFGSETVDIRNAGTFLRAWHAGCGPEADYIALGSLRANIEAIVAAPLGGGDAFDFFQESSHATTPDQIVALLTQAGYRNVQNRALTDYTTARDKFRLIAAGVNLTGCNNLLSMRPGCIVIMLVHELLAKNAKRAAKIEGNAHVPKLSDLHWILVRRMTAEGLGINPPLLTGQVRMKLYTWKWTGLGDFSLADFLPRYYGYISADVA